jgi:hypothetical protein
LTDPVNTPTPNPEPNAAVPNQDPNADVLSSILNSSGSQKYASVNDALNSIAPAQTHISSIETEAAAKDVKIAELEAKLSSSTSMEDMIKQVMDASNTPEAPAETAPVQSLTSDQVLEIIQANEAGKVKQTNLTMVADIINTKYGDKNKEFLGGELKRLGLGESTFKDLMETSPTAALSLIGLSGSATPTANPTATANASVNSQATPSVPADPKPIMGDTENAESLWKELTAQVQAGLA